MAMPRRDMARDMEAEMKPYARRNKRKQLNIKYRWHEMAKNNARKHNKRMRFRTIDK